MMMSVAGEMASGKVMGVVEKRCRFWKEKTAGREQSRKGEVERKKVNNEGMLGDGDSDEGTGGKVR